MPGSGRYGVYTYDMVGQNSVTNSALFDVIFHHKSSLLTHEQLIAVAAALLTPSFAANAAPPSGLPNTQDIEGPMCDPQMFPGGVSMDYTGAPTYPSVVDMIKGHKGAEGWPTTVYTPPLASPGQGNGADPGAIPVTEITEQTIHATYAGPESTAGTVMPGTTSPQVSSTKLDPVKELLVKGEHPKPVGP